MTIQQTARSPLDSERWRLLTWLGVLLIAGLLAMTTASRQWEMSGALVIFLVAGLVIMRIGHLPALLRLLLVSVALLNGAGGAFDWFESHFWFDELVHGYSGFAGMSAIGYLYAREKSLGRARLVWWCTGVGLLLGVGWEIVEELLGRLELMDTLSDLVLDTLGAALGGLFAWQAVHLLRR